MYYNSYNILINNYFSHANMPLKTETLLKSFYVFNYTLCQKEGEEEKKILYYNPVNTDLDSKIRNVGLAEAVIKFTATFNKSETCSSFHTQKTRQVYYEPEKNYWMVMTVNIPYISKTKEGAEYYEYQGDDVQDTVCHSVLKQAYKTFSFLFGTFSSVLQRDGIDVLKRNLEHFFFKYLLTLKLDHCDIINVFGGIQYLPLNNLTFLNVLCFINQIELEFSSIKFSSFMYNGHLIWSGLEPENIQVVYDYMVNTLLPAHLETELQGGSMHRNQPSPFSNLHYGRFVSGPRSLKDGTPVGKIPKVYLRRNNQLEVFYFVVYRSLSASVILFIDENVKLDLEYFKAIDSFMGPELTSLVSEIAEYCSQQVSSSNTSDSSPKFVYFNQLNLAYKSTVHLDNRHSGNISISTEALKLIADLNADNLSTTFYGETVAKTMQDYWIVGKFSNRREFYVAIQHKNANLIEINEEIKKLCDAELKGIFFQT